LCILSIDVIHILHVCHGYAYLKCVYVNTKLYKCILVHSRERINSQKKVNISCKLIQKVNSLEKETRIYKSAIHTTYTTIKHEMMLSFSHKASKLY
jgi:hypothetical protein